MARFAALIVSLCLLGWGQAAMGAEDAPESLNGGAAAAFDLLNEIRPPLPRNDTAFSRIQAQPAPQEPTQKPVHLRGRVTLTGSAFVPFGSAVVTLIGNANVQDDGGQFSQNVEVTCTQTFPVSGSFVSGVAYPTATVQISKDGRLLGIVQLHGTIPVAGSDLSDMVSLSGSGYMEGQGTILDPNSN